MQVGGRATDPARNGQTWDALRPGALRHPGGRLAEGGLAIDLTLRGDDQVGPGELRVEPHKVKNQIHAAAQVGTKEGAQARPQAPGGTCTGQVTDVQSEVGSDNRGEMGEARLELLDLGRGRALLRAIDPGRPTRAQQRIVHVTDPVTAQVGQARVQAAGVDAPDLSQGPADGRDGLALGIQEAHTQRRGHADAAIVGGTPSDADHDAARAEIKGRPDQFPVP